MFIRLEDVDGIGIYRSDHFSHHDDPKFGELIGFLGAITRSPIMYSGMVNGHECLGVDAHLSSIMDNETRFAWQMEFFLNAINGHLTEQQLVVKERYYPDLKFLTTDEEKKKFIEHMEINGVTINIMNGPIVDETEQQVIFYPQKLHFVDQITTDVFYLLNIDSITCEA